MHDRFDRSVEVNPYESPQTEPSPSEPRPIPYRFLLILQTTFLCFHIVLAGWAYSGGSWYWCGFSVAAALFSGFFAWTALSSIMSGSPTKNRQIDGLSVS